MLYAVGGGVPMGDDEFRCTIEIERIAKRKPSHLEMDFAFCDQMLGAIKAGLESAPIGVVTTPGTNNPKYFAAEPWPLASSLGDL
jgi:hypothetical protein